MPKSALELKINILYSIQLIINTQIKKQYMKFTNTLHTKFNTKLNPQHQQFNNISISNNLKNFLSNQSQRIDHLLINHKNYLQKISMVETNNHQLCSTLRQKILKKQKKHQKNRKDFYQKQAMKHRFQLQQRRQRKQSQQLKKKNQSQNPPTQSSPNNHQSSPKIFKPTQQKQPPKKQKYTTHFSSITHYQHALSRKKAIEQTTLLRAKSIKQKLLTKYIIAYQKTQQAMKNKSIIYKQYQQKLQKGLQKNKLLQSQKQQKYLNDICYRQSRSTTLLQSQKKIRINKLKQKHFNEQYLNQKHKSNVFDNTSRVKSTQQLRKHHSIKNDSSITVNLQSLENQQTKKQAHMPSAQERKKKFILNSQNHLHNVALQKNLQKWKQEMSDEKAIMVQKQTADALKIKQAIKNQSNLLVRQARISI